MNQDFMIKATPGMCRRLVLLSKVCKVNLDPAIITKAECDTLSLYDFEPYPELEPSEIGAAQALIDYGFRAVFPANFDSSTKTLLIAAAIAKISPIFVMTKSKLRWKKVIAETKNPAEFIFLEPHDSRGPDPDIFKERRDGLFILEDPFTNEFTLPMDFEKTVILTTRRLATDLSDLIETLFPGAASDILTNRNIYFRNDLHHMGFKSTRPEDLAFLFNVVTNLITHSAVDQDDYAKVIIDTELFENLDLNTEHGHLRHG